MVVYLISEETIPSEAFKIFDITQHRLLCFCVRAVTCNESVTRWASTRHADELSINNTTAKSHNFRNCVYIIIRFSYIVERRSRARIEWDLQDVVGFKLRNFKYLLQNYSNILSIFILYSIVVYSKRK